MVTPKKALDLYNDGKKVEPSESELDVFSQINQMSKRLYDKVVSRITEQDLEYIMGEADLVDKAIILEGDGNKEDPNIIA